jgi:predicted  nucleic acid-binding Zn-ribbon protein
MADYQGLTITFGANTAEFDHSVTGINKALNVLRKDVTQLNKDLKFDPDSLDALAKKAENFKQQITLNKENVAKLEAELKGLDASELGKDKWASLTQQIDKAKSNVSALEMSLAATEKRLAETADPTSVRNLDKAISEVGSDLDIVNRKLQLDPGNVDLAKQKMEMLGQQSAIADQKVEKLKRELSAMGASDAGADEIKKLERELGEAEIQAGQLKRQMDDVSPAAEKATNSFDGSKIANAAKVAGAALAAVGAAAAGAGAALAGATVRAAAYADEIITASTNTHLTTEELQAYRYAAELIDVPLEAFTKSLAKNVKSMSAAAQGNGAAAEAYKKLGVAIKDAGGHLRNGEEVYWDAIDALAGIENETERDALAMQLFGKSAQDLNSLIAVGSKGFAEFSEEAKAMGAVMSDDQLAVLGDFDDAMQRLTSGMGAAKNAMGLLMLPMLKELSDTGVTALGEFSRAVVAANGDMSKIGATVTSLASKLTESIVRALPQFMAMGGNVVNGLLQGITAGLPQLAASAGKMAVEVMGALATALPQAVGAGTQMVANVVSGFSSALPGLASAVAGAIPLALQAIFDGLPLLLEAGAGLVAALVDGIMQAVPKIVGALPDLISAILSFLSGVAPELVEAGVGLLTALVDDLPAIIDGVVEAIPEIIEAIVEFLAGDGIPKLLEAGAALLVAIVGKLPEIIVKVVKAIPEIIAGIVKALAASVPNITKAGAELLGSLVSVFKDVGAKIGEKFKNLVESIKSGIGNMSSIGTHIIDGIINGLTGLGGKIADSIKNAIASAKAAVGNVIEAVFGGNKSYAGPEIAGYGGAAAVGAFRFKAPSLPDMRGAAAPMTTLNINVTANNADGDDIARAIERRIVRRLNM